MVDEVKKGASLNPDDFIAGGLLDDVDATWKNVMFEMYNYGGKSDPAPCLGADLITGAEIKPEDVVRQYWSCGSAENWEPSEDGARLVPVGGDTELRKSTNLFMLLKSLKEAGFPMAQLADGNVTVLNGLKAHMRRIDAPKRGNMPVQSPRRGASGKEYERDNKVLCVEKIIALPSEAPKDEPKAAKKGGKKAAADPGKAEGKPQAPAPSADMDSKAKELLVNIIVQGGGRANKKDIPSLGFKALGTDPDRLKVLSLLFNDEWMKGAGFAVSDSGEITLG
jgi:hypothetical protein